MLLYNELFLPNLIPIDHIRVHESHNGFVKYTPYSPIRTGVQISNVCLPRDISNLCLILFDNGASQFQLHLLPGNNLKQIAVANYFALYFAHLLLGNRRQGNARDGFSVFKCVWGGRTGRLNFQQSLQQK
jgi:hypothetical protein